MKNNKILTSIILFIVVLFNACRKENTQLQVKDIKSEIIKTVSTNQIAETKDDNCSLLLKKLITRSSIQNPFLSTLNVEIDKQENEKLTLKLYDSLDTTKSPVGWIIFDTNNKKLLDITNDPEDPIELKYDNQLYNKITDCYFKTDKSNAKNTSNDCNEISTDEGSKEECIFKNQTIESVYKRTIEKKEIENSNFLLKVIPTKTISKSINQEGIISVDYIIKDKKIIIDFQYEGGVTEILLEEIGANVKRTIIHSAD